MKELGLCAGVPDSGGGVDLGKILERDRLVAAEQVRRAMLAYDGDKTVLNQLWSYDGRSAVARCIALARMADCKGCGARKNLRGQLNTSIPIIEDV